MTFWGDVVDSSCDQQRLSDWLKAEELHWLQRNGARLHERRSPQNYVFNFRYLLMLTLNMLKMYQNRFHGIITTCRICNKNTPVTDFKQFHDLQSVLACSSPVNHSTHDAPQNLIIETEITQATDNLWHSPQFLHEA